MGTPLSFISGPASRVYGSIVAKRNARWDAGEGVVEFDRPVVSVGNLSVGGTGKTPLVRAVVQWLHEAGRRPCIAMRGYKAVAGVSDEAEEYRALLAGTPVVANPNRVDALVDFFATETGGAVDSIVLDDGFQHRRVARVFDIVAMDATRSAFEDQLLPAGWLREPVESLKRAHALVVTHARDDAATGRIIERARKINPKLLVARATHEWTGVALADDRVMEVGWLRGKRVVACCAIGHPNVFVAAAREAAGGLAGEVVLRDHDPFREATVAQVARAAKEARADVVLVTEKDWSKLRRVDAARWERESGSVIVRARMQLAFGAGWEALRDAVVHATAARSASEQHASEEDGGENDTKGESGLRVP